MENLHVAVLVLLIFPVVLLWKRLSNRTTKGLVFAVSAIAVVSSMPWHGTDFVYLKRFNLLIAAATAGLLWARHLGVRWTKRRRQWLSVLAILAMFAVVNYCNYFSFHGRGDRVFLHLHDIAHNYLGSKYFRELGYTDLYSAMLRAEAELHENHFKAIEVRDLKSYQPVHIRTLLVASDQVKAAFSPQRWRDFGRDVDFFRSNLDAAHYQQLLLDHGFNPTPVWALIGGTIAQMVPAGSETGLVILGLLDPLLLVFAALMIRRAFGTETALLVVIFFGVTFGANFGWSGGAFLRFSWLVCLVLGACGLRTQRYVAAGSWFAIAVLLRVFPLVLILPLVVKAACSVWRKGRLIGRYRQLLTGAASISVVLLIASGLVFGLGSWVEFRNNMNQHMAGISPNTVGLTEILSFRPWSREQVTGEEFEQLRERRLTIRNTQLAVLCVPVVFVLFRYSRWRTDLGCLQLGMPLVYLVLSLAGYYSHYLLVLILVHRWSPRRLGLIFAIETIPYVLMLFEERDHLIYLGRGLASMALFLVLELEQKRPSGRS